MNIGIIGGGNIGGTVGRLWVGAGHTVWFGTRHPEGLAELVADLGKHARSATVEEAAAFGDLLFTAAPYGVWPELAQQLAPHLAHKVLMDAANPYPERDGAYAADIIAAGHGSGVPIARLLPGARYVRAFNSVYFETLATEAHRPGERVGIPLASDHDDALAVAAELVLEAGFDPVIAGPLVRARDFDPGTPVYNTGMTGPELAQALGIPRSTDTV